MKRIWKAGAEFALILGISLLVSAGRGRAQSIVATLTTGTTPEAVAVNPATDKIYVANIDGATVSVIDGATDSVTNLSDGLPGPIAVDPLTDKIYAADGSQIMVIDGATNTTSLVPIGLGSDSLAVNPVTNEVYAVNNSGVVTVLNGASGSTPATVATTVTVGTGPVAVAVNPSSNMIYVANFNSNNVTVINGSTNAVAATVAAGANPIALGVNTATNLVYVANYGATTSNNVTVINGSTNTATLITTGQVRPISVAINPVTNTVYVANNLSNDVTVINGTTVTTEVTVGVAPVAVAVNASTNQVYVTSAGTATTNVTVIDGATNATTALSTSTPAYGVAVNPVTDLAYVTENATGKVAVIDGATYAVSDIGVGENTAVEAINPLANEVYVAGSSGVAVIDVNLNAVLKTITDPSISMPIAIAVDQFTNTIYVLNSGTGELTVINGSSDTVTATVGLGVANYMVSLAVNEMTNRIYAGIQSSGSAAPSTVVIDGATNSIIGSIPGVAGPMAVNDATNPSQVYILGGGSGTVTVLAESTGTTLPTVVTTVPVGTSPTAIALNPLSQKIYVTNNGSNNVTVIDARTDTVITTLTVGSFPKPLAVNPYTNTIYVGNEVSAGTVSVIDGSTDTVTATIPAGDEPDSLAVNLTTNKIYAADFLSSNVVVIDGATNMAKTVTDPTAFGMGPVVVDPIKDEAFVASGNSLTVITEENVQQIPLTVTITPLPGNTTNSPTATFTCTPTSNFSPNSTVPDQCFGQLDTWRGPWFDGTFSITTPTLTPGFHILYAYATDGQDGTSTVGSAVNGAGTGTGPLVGSFASYGFLVTPTTAAPGFSASPSPLAFGNELVGATSAPMTVTVTNNGTANLTFGSGAVTLSGTNAADFSITSDGCSGQTVGSTAPSNTCSVGVTFTPSVAAAETASLNFTDNAAGSPQAVSLTGTGVLPTVTLLPASLTFGSTVIGTTSAAQTLTLTNTGSVPLTISSISTSLSGFGQTNTCGTSLAAGGSCTISVTFTPTAAGVAAGTLTITDNAVGSPQTVSLSGTGIAPSVTLSAKSLAFGGETVGTTSAAETVTLTNNSSGALTVTGITASGGFAETNTCGSSVAAGGSCTISVTFTPTVAGSLTGTLAISDNAPNSPQTVALSGTGQDFKVATFTTSETVEPGAGTSYLLNIAPQGGFAGSVALACSGAPSNSSCSVSPSSVTLTGSGYVAPILQVTTTAPSAVPPLGPVSNPKSPVSNSGPLAFWIALLGLAGAAGFVRRDWLFDLKSQISNPAPEARRGPRRAVAGGLWLFPRLALGLILLAMMLWASCGGGRFSPRVLSGGTATGTYTLTVTGTSGSLTHSTTVTLNVQ